MKIHILSEKVASQIAAGEVIERPASVIKELMENSLDAGSHQITIRVEQSGKRLIEVTDDGTGISPQDLSLAVQRHATSKLSTAEELFHIGTLGFRGEALASIGSVARMELSSRPPDAAVGGRVIVDAGHVMDLEQVGVPQGTSVRVENLFYNVPARLKFLKRDLTERSQIDSLVTRYAIAYPSVRIKLFQDNSPILQTTGNGDRREILAALYGVDTARQMLEINLEEDEFSLKGFISPVALTRSNRREITFFVNGRWVQDVALATALLQGYRTMLMVGRFPMAVIFLKLPAEEVDVNVHPAKSEVRFRQPDILFGQVQRAVRRGLLAYSPPPQLNNLNWQSRAPEMGQNSIGRLDTGWEFAADAKGVEKPVTESEIGQPEVKNQQAVLPSGKIPLLKLVGQVGATYLVAEGPDGLYLIDQHAAHERILFEKWMYRRPLVASQALLEAVTFQLPPQASILLANNLPLLNEMGFEIELFGTGVFRIRSIPALFMGMDPASLARVVVEDFEEDETPLQTEVEARLAARICKRAAVKGGHALSVEEQQVLLRDLEACKSPRTCPHGRPTMIHLSIDLLERQFGRRGSR